MKPLGGGPPFFRYGGRPPLIPPNVYPAIAIGGEIFPPGRMNRYAMYWWVHSPEHGDPILKRFYAFHPESNGRFLFADRSAYARDWRRVTNRYCNDDGTMPEVAFQIPCWVQVGTVEQDILKQPTAKGLHYSCVRWVIRPIARFDEEPPDMLR